MKTIAVTKALKNLFRSINGYPIFTWLGGNIVTNVRHRFPLARDSKTGNSFGTTGQLKATETGPLAVLAFLFQKILVFLNQIGATCSFGSCNEFFQILVAVGARGKINNVFLGRKGRD